MWWNMKWWNKALVVSITWIIVDIGVAFVHTSIILKGKITPAQDELISYQYGQALVLGLILIWIFFGVILRRLRKR
jgi:hypothetical protein